MKLSILAVAGLLGACGGGDRPGDHLDASACFEVRKDIPVQISRDVDMLFVVDTSLSMADQADRLTANITRFVNVLSNIEGGLPNVHIGVVSSDVSATGGLLESEPRVAGCAAPSDRFLKDVAYANGERDANYTGDLAEALACIMSLPATGSDIEEPLEAMKLALDGSNPENAGFLREHAFLMVVFMTDEDDCSGGASFAVGDGDQRSSWRCFDDGVACDQDVSSPGTKTGCGAIESPSTLERVAPYVDFLKGLKADPNMVLTSAVVAASDPIVEVSANGPALASACAAGAPGARPAFRLLSFLEGFPQRSSHTSACAEDWSEALILIAEGYRTTLGAPCVDASVDLEPDAEGVQSECAVSQVRYAGTDAQEEVVLPPCSSADAPDTERPCWLLVEDASICPDSIRFDVLRGRESVLSGTTISIRCHGGCY